MSSTLRLAPVHVRQYIRQQHIAEIYEALLSGICVMLPSSPRQWLVEKLRFIQTIHISELEWHTFIDEEKQPKHPFIDEKAVQFIFRTFIDDGQQPSKEMIALAYKTYNDNILKKCLNSWLQYHYRRKENKQQSVKNEALAIKHYNHGKLRGILLVWHEWTQYRLHRQSMAFQILHRVYNLSLSRVIFDAWHDVAVEARKTREYFERLERGEQNEEDEALLSSLGEQKESVVNMESNIFMSIFSKLNLADLGRCSRVCRSWMLNTQNKDLWSKIDFTSVKNEISDSVGSKILTRFHPYVAHLNMQGCCNLGSDTFITVSACRHLQDINLSECTALTDEHFQTVLSGCQLLLYLNISYTNISDVSMRNISKYGVNLQYLSLAFCPYITDLGFQYWLNGKGARKLTYIDLSGCTQITSNGIEHLVEICSDIRYWILNDLPNFDDSSLISIHSFCHNIEHIELLGNQMLTDLSLIPMVNRNLKIVKMDCNHNVSDQFLRTISKQAPDMRHLYLPDCIKFTEGGLKHLSTMRHLNIINFADCLRISDQGIRFLVEGAAGAHIRELNLTNCSKLGDNGLQSIVKRCNNLLYLTISYCDLISEQGLEVLGSAQSIVYLNVTGTKCGDIALSAISNNSKIRHLSIAQCSNVTDLGLQKFAQQCKNLEYLEASMCYQLTDNAIKSLAFCCRYLTYLNLSGCRQMTDLSMQYVSGVCRHLLELDLSACPHVTEKCLKYLMKGCKKLEHVCLLYCKGISKHAAMNFVSETHAKIEHSTGDPPEEFDISTD